MEFWAALGAQALGSRVKVYVFGVVGMSRQFGAWTPQGSGVMGFLVFLVSCLRLPFYLLQEFFQPLLDDSQNLHKLHGT